jgi:hypothetical protein
MSVQIHEAALKWRKVKDLKEEIEVALMDILANPDATDEQVLNAKKMYKGVCTTYLDTKELLCITFPQKVGASGLPFPWHIRG